MLNELSIAGSIYGSVGKEDRAYKFGTGLNYMFGRNALSRSYVSGHGEVANVCGELAL